MKMKNKKTGNIADRQIRRREPYLERVAPQLDEKPLILIVCEGKNTEPSYFKQFRISSAIVKPVGIGYNTVSLVKKATQLASQDKYDQIWCVFDKDDFPDNDFNSAINIAQTKNFRIAYSNQSFEYWFILHFDDHQGGGMHRDDYNEKINKLLKPFAVTYEGKGNKKITEDFFELLNERVELAIKRAKRNYNRSDHSNPAQEESSTTVFKLVEELLKYV